MAYNEDTTRRFRVWWANINRHPHLKKQDIIYNWLKYAQKTVVMRGNQDQQKVVFATYHRFKKSQHKNIRRWQALKVWNIVNQKQENFKRVRAEAMAQGVRDYKSGRGNLVVIKKRSRRIITGGTPRVESS